MSRTLPVWDHAERIRTACATHNRVVIEGPTGSGKSTQVPQMLLDGGLAGHLQIGVLQPRRLAARLLARRVAEERGQPVGGEIGSQVRFEYVACRDTRILYATEGVLLRRMISDADLSEFSILVFDEFHERHVYGDVTLARALRLQQTTRPDLKIVVMSATLDAAAVAEQIGGAEIVRTAGRTFPVEIEYLPATAKVQRTPVWELAAEACDRVCREEEAGDLLVFMPGAYEINKTLDALREYSTTRKCALLPLHGELPPAAQDEAVQRGSGRRIVVATNVAETSITIDGVTAVVDGGLVRVARYDAGRGINTLFIEKISRASADQRAGRAGRTAPGRCLRLWSQEEQAHRHERDEPEILRIDPSEILLTLAAGGEPDVRHFPWIEPPREHALSEALLLLRELGAFDDQYAITPMGHKMAAFPMHPRYARLLIEAESKHCVRQAALVAAIAQGRPLLERNVTGRVKEAREDLLLTEGSSDFQLLLRAWSYANRQGFRVEPCRKLGIHAGAAREAGRVFERFLSVARQQQLEINEYPPDDDDLHKCLLAAFVDHLARRRDAGTLHCEMLHGRSAQLSRDSAARKAGLFVAAEIVEIQRGGGGQTDVLLQWAAPVEEDWLQELDPTAFSEHITNTYDEQARRVVARMERRFYDLVLESKPLNRPDADEAARLLALEIQAGRLRPKLWDRDADQWVARVNTMAAACPDWGVAPIDDAGFLLIMQNFCYGAASWKELKDKDPHPALKDWLSSAQQALLAKQFPDRLLLPAGRRARLTYETGRPPKLSATVQELYGLTETPRLAGGRVPVLCEILSPARRPVQVTDDLASFWKNTYHEVKKELARRYPKHEWR